MSPYYEWDSKKEKFIRKHRSRQKKKPKIRYKRAVNNDKGRILDFEIECIKSEPDIYLHIPECNDLKRKLNVVDFDCAEDFIALLALAGEKVVGFLSMSWYFNYDMKCRVGFISEVWVLKDYRLIGIGTELINFAREEFKKLDITRVELIVGIKNLAAVEFYKRLGFKIKKVGRAILEI